MPATPKSYARDARKISHLLWRLISGLWILPILGVAEWLPGLRHLAWWIAAPAGLILAPLPALLLWRRERHELKAQVAAASDQAAKLKLQLESVRFRTSRLREELTAADKQARLSHQLSLLGQFTAGFMHEFNNPLAIVEGRLEVLLEERKTDAPLCSDLQQMLRETHYMGRLATTLLQALRKERGGEAFDPANPAKALKEAVEALRPAADAVGVILIAECNEGPRVDVPEHVVAEVVRGLLSNAVKALEARHDGNIWARLTPYRIAGTRVVIQIEDNGPGVPESIREHLFEPFVTQSSGRERLGLGLFLAASLLSMYDGRIRYETREGGGASFVVELPPARFTREQPYHWFVAGAEE